MGLSVEQLLTGFCRYDSKEVFKEGLSEMQIKLSENYYTSVQSFGEDMVGAFSLVVGLAAVGKVTEDEDQLSDVVHGLLTAEQKEKKKLAKRILRGVQPLLDDALQKESDLAGRLFERDGPSLEVLLDQRLLVQRHAPMTNGVHASVEEGSSGAGELELAHSMTGTKPSSNHNAFKGDRPVHHAPTPEELSQDAQAARDEAADEAAIAAQLNQDAIQMTTESDTLNTDRVQADNARVAPPTPPGSDQDLLGPIHHGGIPWYMKEFDPEGTTVYEERWSGLEVVRDMSEELSELDDEELNGLAGPEAMVPDASGKLQKVVRNKRKRNRNHW